MSGAGSRDRSGGANYLCLPEKPKYSKTTRGPDRQSAQIDGVKYGQSYFQPRIKVNKRIHCSLCQVTGKTDSIMIPAAIQCPSDEWQLEYTGHLSVHTGHLSVQSKYSRTEYVCLASNKNLMSVNSGRRIRTLHSLDKVHPGCNVLPCNNEKEYKADIDISCVVCTK